MVTGENTTLFYMEVDNKVRNIFFIFHLKKYVYWMSTVYQVLNQALQNASVDAQQHSIKIFFNS